MAVVSTIAAIGIGLAVGGAALNYAGQRRQAQAQEQALAYQQQAEALRMKQMNLDAMRRKREIIRTSQVARAQALATTTAQGASGDGGSSLQGAYGSIAGREGVNTLGVNQNQEIGRGMFAAHTGQLGAYRNAAAAGSMSALGQGISSLGGAMVSNAGTISKVGTRIASSWSR